MSLKFLARTALIIVAASAAHGWDGIDSGTGGAVEISKGNLVRNGSTIEIFDHEAGEYRDVDVQSVRRIGGSVGVEVYDNDSGEYRTLEMDAD